MNARRYILGDTPSKTTSLSPHESSRLQNQPVISVDFSGPFPSYSICSPGLFTLLTSPHFSEKKHFFFLYLADVVSLSLKNISATSSKQHHPSSQRKYPQQYSAHTHWETMECFIQIHMTRTRYHRHLPAVRSDCLVEKFNKVAQYLNKMGKNYPIE